MSRIQDILKKAERDGGVHRTRAPRHARRPVPMEPSAGAAARCRRSRRRRAAAAGRRRR